MIELRRRYSGGVQSPSFSRLPAGYQEVEYLESDGNQYIDLGFRPSVFLKHETEVKYQYLTLFRTSYILASYWEINRGKTTYGVSIRWDSDYIISRIWVEGGQSVFKQIPADTQVHTSKLGFDGSQYYSGIDGELSYNQISDISVLSDNLLAFKAGLETPAIGRIFGIKYSENSEVIHEFIPCKNPQGVAGMYDVAGVYENVHDGFYPNEGTGKFSVGPDVHYNIPFEYQEVEYLESTGMQYMVVNFDSQYHSSGIYHAIGEHMTFGVYNNYSAQSLQLYDFGNDSAAIRLGFAASDTISPSPKYIQMDAVTGKIIYDDNVIQIEGSLTHDFHFLHGIPLFGRFNTSVINLKPSIFKRFYVLSLGNIVVDLIPCYRKEDNVAGMYDIVNNVFYTNAGTGEFIVGPDVIG